MGKVYLCEEGQKGFCVVYCSVLTADTHTHTHPSGYIHIIASVKPYYNYIKHNECMIDYIKESTKLPYFWFMLYQWEKKNLWI